MSSKLCVVGFAALLLTSAFANAQAPVPPSVLASQESNYPGIVAELTEFRRKGNTLTAKVRFRNTGSDTSKVEFRYGTVYLLDTEAGKKYEALKDEKGAYIASLYTHYDDRYYVEIPAGQAQTAWMKFPAPPAETTAITLQLPDVPPFEDVVIQGP